MAQPNFAEIKLSVEQQNNAMLIGTKAEELGIDPDLALALAWTENRFLTNGTSPKGATGLIQVMPANAKAYGYQPKDLLDPNINVEVGLRIFKEGLDRFKGNERAALVAYNANPTIAARYVAKGEDLEKYPELLPQETKNYLENIHSIRPLVKEDQQAAAPSFFDPLSPLPEHLKIEKQPGEEPFIHPGDLFLGGVAAGTVAGLGESYFNKPSQSPAPSMPSSDPRFGTTVNGVSGRAGETGFNLETQRRAQQAAANEELLRKLRQGQIIGDENPILKMGPMTSTNSGILVKPSALEKTPRTKTEVVREGIKSLPKGVGKFLSKYSRLAGPLGGLGAGLEAEEARSKFERGDVIGGALSAASAATGATAITPGVPYPIRGGAGLLSIPLGIASGMYERAHPYQSVTKTNPPIEGELEKLD
jgi:hypothetical protein